MSLRVWSSTLVVLFSFVSATVPSSARGHDEALQKLEGTWLFVEDRTEGRPVEEGGPPMSVKFSLRVEEEAVIYPRSRGDEKITLDGTVIETENDNGSISRYRGEWKHDDGWLEYTLESRRATEDDPYFVLKRVFQFTDEGLLVYVFTNRSSKQVALYRHPEDIAPAKPAKATIADLAWLEAAWSGQVRTSAVEERWSPPKGGAMLGISRTVRGEKMTGFEYLRIVERDGGLVYIAQPGGRSPTEFVLTELDGQRATFVNPHHDYPQRIVYELADDGSLTASIGFAKGRLQSTEFQREND